MEGTGKVVIELLKVLCPECGEPVHNPDSGAEVWTADTLAEVEGRDDHATMPMCGGCGCFVHIKVPRSVKLELSPEWVAVQKEFAAQG